MSDKPTTTATTKASETAAASAVRYRVLSVRAIVSAAAVIVAVGVGWRGGC